MKKISIVTIVVLLLLVIAYMLVGNYFYNYALNTKQEKEFLEGNPHLKKTVTVSGNSFTKIPCYECGEYNYKTPCWL
ncbi:hypothetical protein KOY_05529 [Bacillus cereus VDM021]|nr:hypothetical protein IIW_05241 [Bacillus cereus VD136]EOQ17510.1 hypothetical protein KOY_05529 [Bacillus cereus VDM021]